MQEIGEKIQHLSRMVDLSKLSYREVGRQIAEPGSEPVHPQIVKNALQKLRDSGLLNTPDITTNTTTTARLISIPILGMANAGPATHVAGSTELGTLKVSASLLPTSNYQDFYALEVDGESMNRAVIRGNVIENGAYVIVDSSKKTPRDGEVVAIVHDGLANIKKVFFDFENQVIVLRSESNQDFHPIVISPNDNWEGLVGGTIVHVVNKPKIETTNSVGIPHDS
jgi:SOS-response transcriptional repressor LexA